MLRSRCNGDYAAVLGRIRSAAHTCLHTHMPLLPRLSMPSSSMAADCVLVLLQCTQGTTMHRHLITRSARWMREGRQLVDSVYAKKKGMP